MGRYFGDENKDTGVKSGKDEKDSKEQVYTVTSNKIEQVKKKQNSRPLKFQGNKYRKQRQADPYPGQKPINKDSLRRHDRGEGVNTREIKSKFKKKEQARREEKIKFAEEQSARTEIFLNEEAGFLEGDLEQEFTGQIKQEQIKRSVDEISASKCFDLNLPGNNDGF